MIIPDNLIIFLDEMLYELYENRLESELIPSEHPECAADGGKIRVAISQNVEWYQELCRLNPCTRTKSRGARKDWSKIKRQNVIELLENMVKNKKSESMYAEFLLDVAQSRKETIDRLEKEELVEWNNQF